jgi:antigen flippase
MLELRRILHMSLARGYGVILALAMLFVTARVLGPEGRGTFAAAVAWVGLFATLANLSLGQALQHRLQAPSNKLGLSAQIGTLGGFAVITSFFAIITAAILHYWTEGGMFKGISPFLLTLAFAAVPLLIWEQYSSNMLAAAERTDILNRSQYFGRSIGFGIFLLFLLVMGWGVAGAIAAQFFTQLLVAVFTFLPLWKLAGGVLSWSSREVLPLLRSGGAIHLTTVSAFLLDQISILLINNYLTTSDVGHYQLAQQMVGLLLIVPQSALMVIYGGLAKSTPDAYWPSQRRLAMRVLGGMFVASVLAFLFAPWLVAAIAGDEFMPSVAIFRSLLPSLLGFTLALLMTPQWIGRGLLFLNTFLTIGTSIFVVAASFWAIPRYGLDGAINVRLVVFAIWVPVSQIVFWLWCNRQSNRATNQ